MPDPYNLPFADTRDRDEINQALRRVGAASTSPAGQTEPRHPAAEAFAAFLALCGLGWVVVPVAFVIGFYAHVAELAFEFGWRLT